MNKERFQFVYHKYTTDESYTAQKILNHRDIPAYVVMWGTGQGAECALYSVEHVEQMLDTGKWVVITE